jgi:hypothetical protein
MALGVQGPNAPTTTTPASRDPLVKIGKLEVADNATAFAAFVLPKHAFVAGVYTLSMGANTTQTIVAGFSSGGNDLLTAFAPNATGYATAGAATGTAVGTQLTADKTVYLKASAALTNPVYVKVEYYIPPVGQAF